MTWAIATAWIHYAGIMLLTASLLGEHLFLRADLALRDAKTLQRLDVIFGVSATLVLITGIARIYLEKGMLYYMHDAAFHILVGLFVVIALLSIYPTVVFFRWRKDKSVGRAPVVAPAQVKTIQMILRAELALLILAPLFATWMAHGGL